MSYFVDSGQTEKQIAVTVPHTITDWIGSGFCVSSRSGVGVSDKFKVTVFQPFFVSFTLPYSLVRGERVAIPVSVFNYLSAGCLQVGLSHANIILRDRLIPSVSLGISVLGHLLIIIIFGGEELGVG